MRACLIMYFAKQDAVDGRAVVGLLLILHLHELELGTLLGQPRLQLDVLLHNCNTLVFLFCF